MRNYVRLSVAQHFSAACSNPDHASGRTEVLHYEDPVHNRPSFKAHLPFEVSGKANIKGLKAVLNVRQGTGEARGAHLWATTAETERPRTKAEEVSLRLPQPSIPVPNGLRNATLMSSYSMVELQFRL